MTDIAAYARSYERARDHLAQVSALLGKGKGVETLRKLEIVVRRKNLNDESVGLEMLADALAKAVRDDFDRYVAVVIHRAQDAVTRAASDLSNAIEHDLKQSNMRD